MLEGRTELRLKSSRFRNDTGYFLYLLPVNEENELVRPGPGPGLSIGLHPLHAVCVLTALRDVNGRTLAARRVDAPRGGAWPSGTC